MTRRILILMAALALMLTMASAALAEHDSGGTMHTFRGNLDCGDIGGYQAGTPHNYKVDPPRNGTFTLSNGGQVIISNFDGDSFDWAIAPSSLSIVDAYVILVKGGPYTKAYFYNPADRDPADDSGTGLTAALNPNNRNGKNYGISHITFCFDNKA